MEPPATPSVLARLSSQLNWYWTLSPPGRVAFWATFGGWALDAYNQMTLGFVLPAVTTAFAPFHRRRCDGQRGAVSGSVLIDEADRAAIPHAREVRSQPMG